MRRWTIQDSAADIDGWGRVGDAGLVALDEQGEPVGAAWYRLFKHDDAGYGFVDERTPELSIAIVPEARGRGVGTRLLTALIEHARAEGFQALSLSVESDNPARALYERLGFVRVGGDAAWTMRVEVRSGPTTRRR